MLAILKKEIQSFFSSMTGYLVLGLFVLLTGLFLWVFKNPFNVFDYGFADLSLFFLLVPWVFLFLIPALTMKSFAEEKSNGTLELLLIKPLSINQLVLGKFLGSFLLCVFAIVPSLIYVFAISALGTEIGNYDMGVVIGSYFGLLFLVAAFTAIGVFSSSLSKSQILAFIIAVALCFFVYYGFEAIASLFSDGKTQRIIANIGARSHFESIGKGIIDSRDLVYFLSITLFFALLTKLNLETTTK